jgi:hypothetical protein
MGAGLSYYLRLAYDIIAVNAMVFGLLAAMIAILRKRE